MVNIDDVAYLAVDDDPRMRRILEVIFTYTLPSRQVAIFEDSTDFEACIQALPFVPTLTFLDIAVQPLDGFQMLQIIRAQPRFRGTLVVALTARVMPEDVQRMRACGFDGLISKPIIRQVFPELVQRILAGESIWYVA